MITDKRDPLYEKLVAPVAPHAIRVGILAGDVQHEDDALTILELATIHEFGTDDIDARSFIRAWFDENQDAIRTKFREEYAKAAEGRFTYEVAAERVGVWCVGAIQARIAEGIDPPLDPRTIARKGSSVPLIDTGALRDAITSEVVDA